MTDDCGVLVNTGGSFGILLLAGVALTLVAVVLFVVSNGASRNTMFSRLGVLLLIANVVIGSGMAGPALAASGTAEDCEPTSSTQVLSAATAAPDTSNGEPGQVQRYSVLANDTPSDGAIFDLSTLRLALVSQPVTGSTLSADARTVTAPTEGVYTSQTDGTIVYTPESSFLGNARGVVYTIKDTKGKQASSIYTPTVTSNTLVCVDPASESRILPEVTLKYSDLSYTGASADVFLANSLNPYFRDIEYSIDGTKLVASADYMYTSSDSGQTWTRQTGSGMGDWQEVSMSSDGNTILVTQGWGPPSLSLDGGVTWNIQSIGFGYWYNAVVSADGSTLFAMNGSSFDMYRSTDNGITWTNLGESPNGLNMTASADGQYLVMGAYPSIAYSSGVYISNDGGSTWANQIGTGGIDYNKLTMSANGQTIYASTSTAGILKSTDGGANWSPTGASTSIRWSTPKMSTDGQTVFAVDSDNDVLYRTTNGGSSWTAVSNFARSASIAVSGSGQQVVLVTLEGRILSTNDGGANWTPRYYADIPPSSVDIDPETTGVQRDVDKTSTEGWRATYNPSTDLYRLEVTDNTLFQSFLYTPNMYSTVYNISASYSIEAKTACESPDGAQINVEQE